MRSFVAHSPEFNHVDALSVRLYGATIFKRSGAEVVPTYYFDVFDGEHLWNDEFGVELNSADDVQEQAQSLLPELVRESIIEGERRELSVIVRCKAGKCWYKATIEVQAESFSPPNDPGEV